MQRYSLTVRGGVSLGAYEGGINWALLRVLEGDPNASLTTVTGASAGNINAFLSAVEWCQSPARSAAESPRDNLFWKAWIPVGIHGLFPRGQPKGYAPGDGLFARGAFAPAEATLRQALDDGTRFPAGCPLTVGVTVTRIRPADIVIKSADAAGRRRRDSHPDAAVRLDVRPRDGARGAALPAARRARPRDRRIPDAADEGWCRAW